MSAIEPNKVERLTCSRCRRAWVEAPTKGLASKSKADVFLSITTSLGWDLVDTGGTAFAICPACVGGVYDPRAKCPMCGHRRVGTTYCSGAGCGRGIHTRHLHRTCQRCKYDFIQLTKVDAPATSTPPSKE